MSPWVFKNEEGKTHTHWTKHYSLVLFKTCSPLNHPHQFLSSYLWSSIMDNRRREILCSLMIFMVLKYFIVSTMAIQKTIMYHHNASIMMMAYFLFGSKERVVWKFDRPSGYVSQFLLGSYNAKMFKDRVRVSKTTFFIYVICLDPCWARKIQN